MLLFKRGFGFYAEYNIRLFFYLLFKKFDALCCIDLDTMLPVYYVSLFRKKKRIYDAHEYFSQLKEIVTRPKVYRFWHYIERNYIPKFKLGYTVSQSIADEFLKLYEVEYEVIRNIPLLEDLEIQPKKEKILLYQGSVNEARGFEVLIPAMKTIDMVLHIYGDGNFLEQTRKLIADNGVDHKVFVMGKLIPPLLRKKTAEAYIGINLVENNGLSQYFSLANKFFDYIHHGLPQVTMNFPEYRKINNEHKVAILLDSLTVDQLAEVLNELLNNKDLYKELQQNCLKAREVYTWQKEEVKLINFYKELLG